MAQQNLQLKLQLLLALRSGSISQIHPLIQKIQGVTKINPELYQKFNKFITQNIQGLIQMQKEEREQNQQPKIIIQNVEGEINDGYNSDQSWRVSSSEQDEDQEIQLKTNKEVFQPVSGNKPSTVFGTMDKRQKNTPNNPHHAFKKTSLNQPSTTKIKKQKH